MSQPKWKEVGHIGDVNWPEYDGGPVMIDETGVYPPELEYVETPPDDAETDDPKARWTVWRVVLDKGVPDWGDIEDVADSAGQDPDELRAAFESDDPMERANAYWDWAGHYGWIEFDQYPLQLTCAEINERYPHAELNCYGSIQSTIEEVTERMADESSATGWSYVGDQMQIDIEDDGFDPNTIVSIAEFGDALAVNGDVLVDQGWKEALGLKKGPHPRLWNEVGIHRLEGWLEDNGYELTKYGGRIPSEEGYASADHVIDAVAHQLDLPAEHVEKAAQQLDWWQEEIPWGTSGDGSVWAKRKAGTEERHGSLREDGYQPGDLLLIRYGPRGTQAARVRAVTRTGSLQIDRFRPNQVWRADLGQAIGKWASPTGTIRPDEVIGPLPPNDRRRLDPGFGGQ